MHYAFVIVCQLILLHPIASLQGSLFQNRAFGSHSLNASPKETLPWQQSIDPNRHLTYMDMLTSQLELIQSLGMKEVNLEQKFAYQTSDRKPARISNLCFKNDQFRKVRLTYFDAGESVQVFNSVWYPSFEYDIPLFGVDLISLGSNRVLTVMDFQPLHPTAEYSEKYISPLCDIRNKYPELQGVLSGKIYDDTSFFSKQMLFGRFTDESKVKPVVLPAYNEYVNAFMECSKKAIPNYDPKAMEVVKNRQSAYDIYSAAKDPAVGLFDAYFGKEWSCSFVHDFLFDLSMKPKVDEMLPPVHNFQISASGSVGINNSKNTQSRQPVSMSV
jgi:15,16-dihydrobiliverdin:ferredoxin oxidoreductase